MTEPLQPTGQDQLDGAQLVAIGACFTCKRSFAFNPDTVPSVYIDPVTMLPPDAGGDPERARREPLCPRCLALINPLREAEGRPPITEGPS